MQHTAAIGKRSRGREAAALRLSFRGECDALAGHRGADAAMIGTRVGHIRIIGLLGQGGMGEVYLGADDRLQRRVALKALRNEERLPADVRARLLREARVLSSLDHPNICRIYDYAEGPSCDFLVLELVDGVTLSRALEEGLSRARKLRIARDVVRALAAAHRRGIVHRDLKPDNVMITADGTVKILDFGLARGQAAAAHPEPDADDIETAATLIYAVPDASAIAGTPQFMSPEQARGQTVTTASDLYSFGLLLQMLLTERPPRAAGARPDELLRLAAAGEVLPMTGQPRVVTALVERLTSVAPAERPSAVETLARLEHIIATPARRLRYLAAAVVVALFLGGGIKYAVDVTAARREAERRRDQAERLVAFMVDDLPKRLEPVGRLDVLDDTATRALEYFASLRPEELTGDDGYRHAVALTQLGDVRMKQGKLSEALEMFRQSLRFAEAAVKNDPRRDEWQLALSNSHFWVGDALRRQGDARRALAHFRAYYEISARLAAAHPEDPKYQTELSYGHSNLGSAYEALGDLERAGAEYRTAVAVDRRLLARAPQDETRRGNMANSLNKLSVLLQAGGDLAGARAGFEEDAAMRRSLLKAKPDDMRRASRLAVSLAYLAVAQANTGDMVRAEATNREELAIMTSLARRDLENLDWQRGRAVAEVRLAEALAMRGEDGQAAGLLASASATLSSLVAREARPTWQRDLAAAHHATARLLLRRGDAAGGSRHYALAASLANAAHARQAADGHAARVLCAALVDQADLDDGAGRADTARQRRQRVVALAAEPAYGRDPRVSDAAARALLALGRPAEARVIVARLVASGYRRPDFIARWGPPESPR